MRFLGIALLLLVASCTEPNSDYCAPENFDECARAYFAARGWERAPDLAGFVVVPIVDMTTAPDMAQLPPDMLPPYLVSVGQPCDGGAQEGLSCVASKQCVALGNTCRRTADCCDSSGGATAYCGAAGCCSGTWGGPCRVDKDCCFNPTGPDFPHCKAGVCSR